MKENDGGFAMKESTDDMTIVEDGLTTYVH